MRDLVPSGKVPVLIVLIGRLFHAQFLPPDDVPVM